LERTADAALYRQVAEKIESLIVSGAISRGTRLPTTRSLAKALGVSRATVIQAYDLLRASGLTDASRGRGTFVSYTRRDAEDVGRGDPRDRVAERALSKAARSVADVPARAVNLDVGDRIKLHTLNPHIDGISLERFVECLGETAGSGTALWEYGATEGYLPLREFISDRLVERDLGAPPGRVILVAGALHGLSIVAETLIDEGDVVAVEEPCYQPVVRCFLRRGAAVVPVPVTAEGLDLDALRRVISRRRPKLVVVTPTHQNPTGAIMPIERRRELAELAARTRTIIVEDGFTDELSHSGHLLPPVAAFDKGGRAIYISGFSKTFLPAVRIGWVYSPKWLTEHLSRTLECSQIYTSPVIQAAMYRFCERGYFDHHLRRIRATYEEKCQAMHASLREHLPACSIAGSGGGLSLWVTLGVRLDHSAPLRARDRGVLYGPGPSFYRGPGGFDKMRLSFSAESPERIVRGIRLLGELVREVST
jgi:GntR family transcriptional regulator/MocR family aminotransferase